MMDDFRRVKLVTESHVFEGGSLSGCLFLHLPAFESVSQNPLVPSLIGLPVILKFDKFSIQQITLKLAEKEQT